jgi:hypothetical protein
MWTASRAGNIVEVRSSLTKKLIATIGEPEEQITRKVSNAKIIAQAPEMLEALIEVQELVKREFIDTGHPLAELVTHKINNLIQNSFIRREQHGIHEDRDFRPGVGCDRVSKFIRSKQAAEARDGNSSGIPEEIRNRVDFALGLI